MSFTTSQYDYHTPLTPARLVSTTNIAGTYSNGPLNNGVGATLTTTGSLTTIDSVTLLVNDRVLLVGQTSANQNGLYVVTSIGTTTLFTRARDFKNIEQLKEGQFVPIAAGTADAGSMWVLVEPLPAQFGISNIVFNSVESAPSGTFLQPANNLLDVQSIPTARTNLGAQAQANIRAGVTGNIGGAGAGPITVTTVGLTTSSIVVATVKTSSNPCSVISTVAGTGNFTVTFSADPGANCTLNYEAFVSAQ